MLYQILRKSTLSFKTKIIDLINLQKSIRTGSEQTNYN